MQMCVLGLEQNVGGTGTVHCIHLCYAQKAVLNIIVFPLPSFVLSKWLFL